jgi:hypothetical protein
MVSSGRVFVVSPWTATTGTTNKGNQMTFSRTKEFIKYHFIHNIVTNLLLLIHIVAILGISIFLYTKSVKAGGVSYDEKFIKHDLVKLND